MPAAEGVAETSVWRPVCVPNATGAPPGLRSWTLKKGPSVELQVGDVTVTPTGKEGFVTAIG
ncbi:MAG: hypothetical protein H0U90_09345 [Actinobacteria bacterium]|nr:hypothetical protein [Actinomycetota bacterium]